MALSVIAPPQPNQTPSWRRDDRVSHASPTSGGLFSGSILVRTNVRPTLPKLGGQRRTLVVTATMTLERRAGALLPDVAGSRCHRPLAPGWMPCGICSRTARLPCLQRMGKSAVYSIATPLMRERRARTRSILSPLLALMRNEITAAERLRIGPHDQPDQSESAREVRRLMGRGGNRRTRGPGATSPSDRLSPKMPHGRTLAIATLLIGALAPTAAQARTPPPEADRAAMRAARRVPSATRARRS